MKIVVADINLLPHRERFEAALPPDSDVRWRATCTAQELLDDVRDADVYVGGRFSAELARTAEKLQLVHAAGAGTDRVDVTALAPDVLVANTFHHEASIAEFIVSAAVMLRRGFPAQDRALRGGRWASSVYDAGITQPGTLQAAKVGFVGFGHIGQCAWKLFQAFGATGATVTGSGKVAASAHDLRWAGDTTQLDQLLRESDVVVVSAPLTAATAGMIGTQELRALGPEGVLINVGRGPLVVEGDLYNALAEREIAGAAIDVWYNYPGPDGKGAPSALQFGDLPQVLMTPHSSGVTRDTFVGRADEIAANIGRLSRGEPLVNVVAR